MAIAHSPGRTLAESPRGATGNLDATTFTTATSVSGSPPSTLPLKVRPSGRVTVTALAPSTTWALVRITPSERVMKPEPRPCCCWIEGPWPNRPPIGLITRVVVSMRTTAGPTLATASTITLPPGRREGLGGASEILASGGSCRPGNPGKRPSQPASSMASTATVPAEQLREREGIDTASPGAQCIFYDSPRPWHCVYSRLLGKPPRCSRQISCGTRCRRHCRPA